jgi:hypothetical protein
MHPIDTTSQQREASPSGFKTGWWALFALAVVMALLVTAMLSVADPDLGQTPEAPQPTEAPPDPGA